MSLNIAEAIGAYVKASSNKVKSSTVAVFIKACFAGMFIGMGAAGSNVAAHNIGNVGVARLVAGSVFPVGLMMVILLGAELFTGDCLAAMAVSDKKISVLEYIKLLITVYLGNFVGGAVFSLLIVFSNQLNYSSGLLGAYTINVAVNKVNLDFGVALVSGILCNILVCAAVLMANCSKDITGKLFVCFFVIMLFVTSGFEHCVANMYYITAGLLAKMNPSYVAVAVEQYHLDQNKIDSLNIMNFLYKNLLPVTIGNIVGGAALLGLPLYYLNSSKQGIKDESVKEVIEK